MAKSKTDYTKDNSNDDFAAAKSVYSDMRTELASEYPEIQEIREDLNSLKDNVFELSRHVKKNSGHYVSDAKHYAEKQLEKVRQVGADALHKVEGRVVEKPGQAVAMAFIAGLAASFLLGRRR